MNKWIKSLISIGLFFAFCFTTLGYANISKELVVEGSANAKPIEGLYIVSAEMVSTSSGGQTVSVEPVELTTNLKATFRGSQRNSSVTYKIVVANNTDYKYTYSGIEYTSPLDGYNGNQYIKNGQVKITTKKSQTDTSATFNTSSSIEPRTTVTFFATYALSNSWWGLPTNQDLATYVNFKFGVNLDSVEDVAIENTFARFLEILNDSDGAYLKLTDYITKKYTGGGSGNLWRATYMGNVVGSSDQDTAYVEELFGDNLSIKIDDVQTDITLLIKREDVDGDVNTGDDYELGTGSNYIHAEGNEMTLYMTTDKLNNTNNNAVVYAAVFTCDKNEDGSLGPWYLFGDTYVGTAPVVSYEGDQSGTGSFHTDTWVSSQATYTVTDDYSYSIARNVTIKNIVMATDRNAVNKMQSLLDEAYEIIDAGEYAGSAMVKLQTAFNNAAKCYTLDANGKPVVDSTITRAQLVPYIKSLDVALRSFEGLT